MTCVTYLIGKIGDIILDHYPVVEVNREVPLTLHVFDTDDSLYSGSVSITVVSNNRTGSLNFESTPQKVLYHLFYQYVDTYKIQVNVSNGVSSMNKITYVEVVCKLYNIIIMSDHVIDKPCLLFSY